MAILRFVATDDCGETLLLNISVAHDEVALLFDGLDKSFQISGIEDITQLIAYCSTYLSMYKTGELQ